MEILWISGLLLVSVIALIIYRTIRFKPPVVEATESPNALTPALDEARIISHLQEMIRCKTVSYHDQSKMDAQAFKAFKDLLKAQYPLINATCTYEEVGERGILFHWKGKHSDASVVLMSHYDVVPVNEDLWSKPPFEGVYEEGAVWGRGTLDTKSTLLATMESVEYLIGKGFQPEDDIYLAFSGDEEISGMSAPAIVQTLKERGIHPKLVLDEGGAVVEKVFPGVVKPCALIGVGEKGYMDVILEIDGKGGHSSAPPARTLVGELAAAVVKLEKSPFRAIFTPAVKEMFETLGRHSNFFYRLIFANLWCFAPTLKWLLRRQGGEMNAMIRTTIAPTMMQGSSAFNVMPPKASVGINLRLLGTDTVESAIGYIQDVIDYSQIKLTVAESRNASPFASTKSESWQLVKEAIEATWHDVIVSPYLMMAASDSRHYCEISENVLRFSAMTLSKAERELIHGNDERIKVSALMESVSFYVRLIEKL